MEGFAGKVAAVTGAGSGIGRATAQIFAREGAKLLLADLAELQARRPDRPLEVGDLEVDHFMAP